MQLALALAPQSAPVLLLSALARDQLGMNTLAEEGYRLVVSLVPDSADALCLLAISLHRRCLYSAALSLCEQALVADACHVLALITRGDTLKRLPGTNSELSTADFALAMDLGGERAQRLIGKGFTFQRLRESLLPVVVDWLSSLVCPLYIRSPVASEPPVLGPPTPAPPIKLNLTSDDAEVLNRIAIFSENGIIVYR